LNGEQAVDIDLNLNQFMAEQGNYTIELVQDGKDKRKVDILRFNQSSSETMKLHLQSGGGFLIKVSPIH
jgi:hypothetical protein